MTLISQSLCFVHSFIVTVGSNDCCVQYHNHPTASERESENIIDSEKINLEIRESTIAYIEKTYTFSTLIYFIN
jgi:hypothetical protein